MVTAAPPGRGPWLCLQRSQLGLCRRCGHWGAPNTWRPHAHSVPLPPDLLVPMTWRVGGIVQAPGRAPGHPQPCSCTQHSASPRAPWADVPQSPRERQPDQRTPHLFSWDQASGPSACSPHPRQGSWRGRPSLSSGRPPCPPALSPPAWPAAVPSSRTPPSRTVSGGLRRVASSLLPQVMGLLEAGRLRPRPPRGPTMALDMGGRAFVQEPKAVAWAWVGSRGGSAASGSCASRGGQGPGRRDGGEGATPVCQVTCKFQGLDSLGLETSRGDRKGTGRHGWDALSPIPLSSAC